jgi:ribosomal protein S18 acetylase RimI-like enzyme
MPEISVFDQSIDGVDLKLLMLTIDGQAIGSCQIASWNEDHPCILGINIDPQHRRRGYGSALIRKAIEMARAEGKISLSLTVESGNAEAMEMYRKLGFVTDLVDPIQFWMSIILRG